MRNVIVRLGGRRVVDDLSFDVRAGERVILLGRSGSGKSTTLRLVNRLLEPDAGEVVVLARPAEEWDPIVLRRGIGYVIQQIGLFPHFTTRQNIELVPRLLGWDEARRRQRVDRGRAPASDGPGRTPRAEPTVTLPAPRAESVRLRTGSR